MGRITTGVGLVSGINSKDIIDQLMQLEAQPKTLLQGRIDNNTQQKLAFTDLVTRLTSLNITAASFKKPSNFQAASTSSSDESVLTATASNGAAIGSYQFQVARLVSAQQTVSQGFADFDSAKVGAGTLTIEMGGGELATQNSLADLNGGAGVRRGQFRITDRAGHSSVIDISAAVSLDDVIKKINTSLDVQVKATINGDNIVLSDLTGKTANNLTVQDLADGHAAADLGIAQDVGANAITGTDINFLGATTSLATINDGRGIRKASSGNDLAITLSDSSVVNVSLASAKSIGDVVTAINTAGGTNLKAELVAGGNGIKLTDSTGATGPTVADVGDSHAAEDLGLNGTASGGVLTGGTLLAGLGTVLLSSLNGGTGLTLATLSVQSRAASSATDIDLSGAKTVQDVLDTINNANAGVTASLNSSQNGIQITDSSGGTGSLILGGAAATSLGVNGTFDINTPIAKGTNLQRQWFTTNTLLADLNGGKGVRPGKFTITNTAGKSSTVDLTQGNEIRIQDVIKEINTRGIGVTATINAHGDGLLLTDTAGGTGKLKVIDTEGTAAADMNIATTSTTGTTIDGSYEKTIAVTATDTLQDLQKKINDLGFGVTAQIINDGTNNAPYRLSLNANNSGRDGRVVFDAGTTTLNTQTLVQAQDAAVFFGGVGSAQPMLITASRNQLSGVIKGVNINLNSVSDGPVTLSVTRNSDNVSKQMTDFVSTFNDMVDKIAELTKWDSDTNTGGLLLGDATAQEVQTTMYSALNAVVPGAGKYRTLRDVGLSLDDAGHLEFDSDKFTSAYADDPDGVQKLFTNTPTGLSAATLTTSVNQGAGVHTAANGGADFRITLSDGSTHDINLANATTIGDILSTLNTEGATKFKAEIPPNGKNIRITDTSSGHGVFKIEALNASAAGRDLGIIQSTTGVQINGGTLMEASARATGSNAGFGYVLGDAIGHLTDPVNGIVTRENKTLDAQAQQFNDRMKQLDDLLEQKRTRLETQFANLESVLSGLQSQQTSIGQIKNISSGTS